MCGLSLRWKIIGTKAYEDNEKNDMTGKHMNSPILGKMKNCSFFFLRDFFIFLFFMNTDDTPH